MHTNDLFSPGTARHGFPESQDDDSRPAATAPSTRIRCDAILRGDSVAARRLRSQVERVAPYFRTALLRGETGSGKQLVARAMHALSPAGDGPFIVSSAAALAEAVAAQDASPHRPAANLLESAQGGTLYLDGMGELNAGLQGCLFRFMRALDNRRATQPGRSERHRPQLSAAEIRNLDARIDTRILAASHRDLRTLSAIGQFRQDLYARLSTVEISVPALRQRAEDLPLLAAFLLRRLANRSGQSPKLLAEAALAQLQRRPWPGNLGELERAIALAASLAEGAIIEPRHLLAPVEPASHARAASKVERLHDVIQRHVLEVLTRCGGNKLRAAELLGISRSTLYRMLDANSTLERSLPE